MPLAEFVIITIYNFFSSILKRQVNVYHHYNYEFDFRRGYMLIQLRFQARRQFSSGTPVFSVNKTDPHKAYNTIISNGEYP